MSGKMVQFKLDTAAELSAISRHHFRSFKGHKLMKPSRTLNGPVCGAYEVIGQFDGRLSHGRKYVIQTIYVVKGLRNNQLDLCSYIDPKPGSPWLTRLQLQMLIL